MKEKTLLTAPQVRRGFTLIELLVVIAIIALLAAILFPVFARARENARKSSCANNMKQIGVGIAQYTQDFDEMLPPSRNNGMNNATTTTTVWHVNVLPYIKNTQVFKCPSVPQNAGNITNTGGTGQPPAIPISYVSNAGRAGTDVLGPGGNRPMADTNSAALADLESVSSTILVLERRYDTDDKMYEAANIYDAGNSRSRITGHLGSSNYLFADGHLKSYKPTATIAGRNMWINASQLTVAAPTAWRDALQNAERTMQ